MHSDRRAFLQKMSQVGALSLLPVTGTLAGEAAVADEKNRFVVGPYLQHIGPNEATIMWITGKNCFSWVEYGGRDLYL